ncbi:MAG TPA: 3-isopropylmalate dehydrogenase [Thermoanaerobaculia bacterium]|nr:3-isopropylmalate dehydrogenase [Thermoanaerobaculia bacterium]
MVKIAVIPGDGIGPEVTREGVRVLEHFNQHSSLGLELVTFDWGADRYLATGVALPPGALDELREGYAAIYLGAIGDPRAPDMQHARDIVLGLRFGLDLYVNYRPVRLLHDRLSPLRGKGPAEIDFVVLRENTEGPYAGVGGTFKRDTVEEVALQQDVTTRVGVERIVRYAFELARRSGRRSVCMADKHNVQPHAGGLWLRTFRRVAAEYPDVESFHLFADAAALHMVREPERFAVIVTNNLFGDLLTDLGAALEGGLGMAASANLNPGRLSMFEPIHGSAPELAGRDVANPMGMILTAALMLRELGRPAEARQIEEAVTRSVAAGEGTPDIGGTLGTRAAGDAVLARLRAG